MQLCPEIDNNSALELVEKFKEILLIRYGFEFEDFDWIKDVVSRINEDEIVFSNIENLTNDQKKRISKFCDEV